MAHRLSTSETFLEKLALLSREYVVVTIERITNPRSGSPIGGFMDSFRYSKSIAILTAEHLIGHMGENPRKMFRPPGLHLWKLAEFFCTKKTYDSIFCPLLADYHHEYFDAHDTGGTVVLRALTTINGKSPRTPYLRGAPNLASW
jgi:hypothetical protein